MGLLVSGIYKRILVIDHMLWCTFITPSQMPLCGGIMYVPCHRIDIYSLVSSCLFSVLSCLCKLHRLCISLKTLFAFKCVSTLVLIYCLKKAMRYIKREEEGPKANSTLHSETSSVMQPCNLSPICRPELDLRP